ncbi:alkaline phosphatase-like protein [Aulographum hederae CBS 113979]|uniref:Alkaline phosphatase-like protein n=1 Tax=Aulographum hederae CBS 113979 TaxID=1176131 RepID=A0A6G1GIM7_9PEZI|nr:alkaline phosphatase-like protein [Aulographum hederae CBS 113979]
MKFSIYTLLSCIAAFPLLVTALGRPENFQHYFPRSKTQPNILFFLTDDQDIELGSLEYTKAVVERIQKPGMGFTFENHYATVALCCPSRVALLRGQHAHNTNITHVAAPGGGYDKFRLSGEDNDYLPHWLRKAGYHSEYIGKLMNHYGIPNFNITPKGWDHFDGLLDPYTYIYNTPVFSANGQRPILYEKQQQTDVMRAKAVDRLQKLTANSTQPWFLQVAPVAPHQEFNSSGQFPPVPATRHQNLYPGLKAPRTPNFNPATQKKPSWIGRLPLMSDAQIAFADDTYRRRAQALKGIDELIADCLSTLEASGQLSNTIIIFSSDHGYHTGNHRIPAGKSLPYKEDTHVPFFISGPGIPAGGSTEYPSNHVDIAPTILSLVGLPKSQWPPFLDGRDLSQYWSPSSTHVETDAHEIIQIEYWGAASVEGALTPRPLLGILQNSYKTVRIVGEGYAYLYSHWCTHETELYDTIADPYELSPLDISVNGSEAARIAGRLNGLLLTTKACAQDSCRNPWAFLHPPSPNSNSSLPTITTLSQALSPAHDVLYTSLPPVTFGRCMQYQDAINEAPYAPGFDESSKEAFAREWRGATDNITKFQVDGGFQMVRPSGWWGREYVGLSRMEVRELTDGEVGW